MTKIKIQGPEVGREFFNRFAKGLRTQCLGRLILLMYVIRWDTHMGGLSGILIERVKEDRKRKQSRTKYMSWLEAELEVMTIEEIMKILGVGKRTAIDYRDCLKEILMMNG